MEGAETGFLVGVEVFPSPGIADIARLDLSELGGGGLGDRHGLGDLAFLLFELFNDVGLELGYDDLELGERMLGGGEYSFEVEGLGGAIGEGGFRAGEGFGERDVASLLGFKFLEETRVGGFDIAVFGGEDYHLVVDLKELHSGGEVEEREELVVRAADEVLFFCSSECNDRVLLLGIDSQHHAHHRLQLPLLPH